MPRREDWLRVQPHRLANGAWTLLAAAVLVLISMPAEAYIGPGTGISALGAIAALVGAFLLLIVGFVWYPVKRLRRRMKGAEAKKHG